MTERDPTNPLFGLGFAVPFDRIEGKHVVPALSALIGEAKSEMEAVATHPGPRTYDNTLGRMEAATERLEIAMTVVGHLESVTSEPSLREAYNEIQPEVSAFYASIPLHAGLWKALKTYAETDEAKAQSGARRRFLEKTLDDFRRHGADLAPEKKARLQEITRALAELTTKFAQNVVDATAAFELVVEDEAKLAGLPESAVEAAAESARQKGKQGWRFTLQAPSVIPVLTYLDDAGIREQVYRAFNRRGSEAPFDNRPLLPRILELRREQATLLGYPHFADLVLEDRMAKRGDAAMHFVRDLTERTLAAFQRENAGLHAFRRSMEGEGAPPLQPWDVGYYAEKQRLALYEFDEEELRPYFPAPQVLEGLFATAERLYGVRVEPVSGLPVWHESVLAFQIADADGRHLATFYVDLYPREEKRGGAWMNGIITGNPHEGRPHLALMCANLTPPVGEKPALLTHDEVTTIFHEFGHLLHHALSRVEVRSLAGTNVAWDFVELPSQIMENWCWEQDALDLFGRHFETGDRIPRDLFEKMIRARTFRAANAMMRQLGFACVDLMLHTEYPVGAGPQVVEYAREILQRYSPAKYHSDHAFIAAFNHLFSSEVGYAAGYYSYKWAEVLDADAFTRFKEAGVFSAQVGHEFRSKILERGDAADPMALYREFMGREPALDALLERSGLS